MISEPELHRRINELEPFLQNYRRSPYAIRGRRALLCIYVHIRLFVEKFQRRVGSRMLTIRSKSPCYMHDPGPAKMYFYIHITHARMFTYVNGHARALRSRDSRMCRTLDVIHRNPSRAGYFSYSSTFYKNCTILMYILLNDVSRENVTVFRVRYEIDTRYISI